MENKLDKHVKAYEGEIQYDFDNQILLNWYPKRILKFCSKTDKLLELGLGHGYTTNIFSDFFHDHTVIEGSDAVIKNFARKYPGNSAKIVKSYFEEFASHDLFDVIVMGFVLEHVDDPIQILTHFRQFLSPNGRIFVAVPNAEVLNRRLGHIAGMLPDMQALSENDHMLGHQRYYSLKSLKEDITKAGYHVQLTEGIYLKPLATKQMLSLNFEQNIIDAFCIVGIDYPELCCGMLAELKPMD